MPVQAARKNERFFKTLANAMPGLVAYWDSDLICRFANKSYREWFGKSPEQLIGNLTLKELLGEQGFALNEPYVRGALAGVPQRFERTLTKADGTIGYTLTHYVPDVDDAGTVAGFIVLATDVTPLKAAEAELKLAASVFTSTDDGIAVTDVNGTYIAVNPAFTKITGYAAEEAIGKTPRILRSNRHDKAFYAAMWKELTTNGRWSGELWNRRKDGEIYPEQMTITEVKDSQGADIRYVAVFNDVTDVWRKDEHVRHLAFHDALTDLPNRSLLTERLDHQIALALREHRELVVMFLDLDGFKLINDSLGHDVGDEVLKTVAQRLIALLRQTDTVARLGGDEFVIVLDNPANRGEVEHITSRVVASINEPMTVRSMNAHVGCSIGIAVFPVDGNTPAELIKNADAAMYAAKGDGKNRHGYFEATKTPDKRICKLT